MVNRSATRPGAEGSLRRWVLGAAPALLLLPLSGCLPQIDLTGAASLFWFGVAESGSVRGIPCVALLGIALLASRPGLAGAARQREVLTLVVLLVGLLGGVAWLNEHVVKPRFAAARPDIRALARARALGMSAERFYALPDKASRSDHLRNVLEDPGYQAIPLRPAVREHWLEETGFSFPSGHATTAWMLAAFFGALAWSRLSAWRLLPFRLLPLWALLVCWSRPLLRVHTPTDVTVGGLAGVVLGCALFGLASLLLDHRGSSSV